MQQGEYQQTNNIRHPERMINAAALNRIMLIHVRVSLESINDGD